jgi:hypothetical protein
MPSYNKYLIHSDASIKLALEKINGLVQNFTLFVVCDNKILGTLTDGDIRRGLLLGLNGMNWSCSIIVRSVYQKNV